MYPLNEKNIFFILFCNLDIKDIIIISNTNKSLNLLCNDDDMWRMKYFSFQKNNILYKKYMKYTYLKHSKQLCFICNKLLIKNVFLTFHNCSYILKKCYFCKNIICSCNKYILCHSECIKKMNNNIYTCQFCNNNIKGYLINYNI